MLQRPCLVSYFCMLSWLCSVGFRYGEGTPPNFWGSSQMTRSLLLRNQLPTIPVCPRHMLMRMPSLLKRLSLRRCCARSLLTKLRSTIPRSASLERPHRSWRPQIQPNKPLFLFLFSLWCLNHFLLDSAGSLIGALFHDFGGLCLLFLPNNLGSSDVIKLAMHFFKILYSVCLRCAPMKDRPTKLTEMHCFDR